MLSAERIQEIAGQVLEDLPEPFGAAAVGVGLRVVEMPPADVLRDLGIRDPLSLTGLYDGVPVTQKSAFDQPIAPDVIWLYRQPILAELAERPDETAEHLVRHIVVHELAHHFGWSDADIAAVDRWWE